MQGGPGACSTVQHRPRGGNSISFDGHVLQLFPVTHASILLGNIRLIYFYLKMHLWDLRIC